MMHSSHSKQHVIGHGRKNPTLLMPTPYKMIQILQARYMPVLLSLTTGFWYKDYNLVYLYY